MNAPLRHPNNPSTPDVDYYGRVAWLSLDDLWVRDLHLHEARIEIVGTGGTGYRVEVIKIGDAPMRELDPNDHWDRVIWDEVVKRVSLDDVIEAFERG